MLQVAGTQPLIMYIGRIQATVAEWVSTRPIFEVCAQEDTGIQAGGGEGRRGGGSWRQTPR